MSSLRLKARVPSATMVSVASLKEHKLKFHKKSNLDDSGKCDAEQTGNPDDFVIGVVFEISAFEKLNLDKIEGLGFGYEEKLVTVTLSSGEPNEAFTYYATNINSPLKPYHWYKEHVLRGARENRLPGDYIRMIENVESIADPDAERHSRELLIYQ